MKRLMVTLGLALFLTGCVEEKVVYLNEKGGRVEARSIPDWSNKVNEVCLNGVVYYTYIYGNQAGVTPKSVANPLGDKLYLEKC